MQALESIQRGATRYIYILIYPDLKYNEGCIKHSSNRLCRTYLLSQVFTWIVQLGSTIEWLGGKVIQVQIFSFYYKIL